MTPRTFFQVIIRRRVVVGCTLLTGLLVIVAMHQFVPKQFTGQSSVLMTNTSPGTDPQLSINILPSLATSSTVLTRVAHRLGEQVSPSRLKSGLKGRVRGSIMLISFHDPDPDLAVEVPNAVADELTEYYAQISSMRYNQDTVKLQSELSDKRRQLDGLDGQLQKLAARGIFPTAATAAADGMNQSGGTGLDTLLAERAQAYATLQSDQAYADASRGPIPTGGNDSRGLLATDSRYQQLSDQLARDEASLAAFRAQYTSDYPGLAELQRRVASERSALAAAKARVVESGGGGDTTLAFEAEQAQRKADALVAADRAKVDALDQEIAVARNETRAGVNGMQADAVKAERDSVNAQFLALSQQLAATLAGKATAASLGTIVVVDRAQSADLPFLTGRVAVLFQLVIVCGLALASGFLAERLDGRSRLALETEAQKRQVVANFFR